MLLCRLSCGTHNWLKKHRSSNRIFMNGSYLWIPGVFADVCTMHAFLLGAELKLADSEQKVSEEQWIEAHGAGGDSIF